MIADFNNDDWMYVEMRHEKQNAALVLRIKAKQAVRVTEIQGFTSDIEAFGLSMPKDFHAMKFGDDAKIPEQMKSEIEHMNRLNFRWGCSYSIKPESELEISIPATGLGKDKACLTLGYEYPKLFGLLKGRNSIYVRLS